jgi:hypothetical protein
MEVRMSAETPETIVIQFVLDILPATQLQAYRLLASLPYPLPDRQRLEQALKHAGQNLDDVVIAWIVSTFRSEDFLLHSPRNALETFYARLRYGRSLPPRYSAFAPAPRNAPDPLPRDSSRNMVSAETLQH